VKFSALSLAATLFVASILAGCGSGIRPNVAQSASQAASSQTAPTINSMQLAKFQDSLGVNIHIEYTDGKYVNAAQVLKDLQYIGINNVRDSIPNSTWDLPTGLAGLKYLAGNGIRFDFISNCDAYSLSYMLSELDTLTSEYPGIALSVEGPNEINNEPCTQGSGTNEQNAEAWQKALYAGVHGDSSLKNVPVLYFTGLEAKSDLTGLADSANTHPYPRGGSEPYTVLASQFSSSYPDLPSSTMKQITETGYATDLNNNSPDAVSEQAQETMGLNIYFDAALQGNVRTYVYQLLEAYPTPDGDTSYGLFRYDGTPKPLAVALHNLAQLLPQDQDNTASVSVTGTFQGLPPTAHQLALTASDGSIYLFVWNEVPAWNNALQSTISYSPSSYTVNIPGNWKIESIDPTSSSPLSTVQTDSQGNVTAVLQNYPTCLHFIPS
jgi:hypothetical protein